MKKNYKNFIILLLVTGVSGLMAIIFFEELFGIAVVFYVSTALVLISGAIVVVIQTKKFNAVVCDCSAEPDGLSDERPDGSLESRLMTCSCCGGQVSDNTGICEDCSIAWYLDEFDAFDETLKPQKDES